MTVTLSRGTRGIERADRTEPLPASSGQRQMWLLHQLAPTSPAYLMTWTLRITGRLDLEALRQAWDLLVARHDILRTRYRQDGATLCQIIDPPGPVAFRQISLAGEPAARRTERAEQIAAWERRRPFDLTTQWPVRISVVEVAPEQHLMVVNIHHIACDDVSLRIIVAELDAFYTREIFGTGTASAEPEAQELQYADYAVWESERDADALRPSLDFWRRELEGAKDLPLPLDRPRPTHPDRTAGLVELQIKTATAEAIRSLAVRHRASPFIVLLAAYHVMLGQLTGSDDVTVGVPVSSRTPGLDELVGYFVNTVVSRSRDTAGATFTDVLTQVRTRFLDSLDHRFAPFQTVVDELNPNRDVDGNPLFQAAIDLEQVGEGGEGFRLAGLLVERIGSEVSPDAKFDLTLHLGETADRRMGAQLEYAAAVISRESAQAWAEQWESLLEQLVSRPDEPIADAPVRTAATEPPAVDAADGSADGSADASAVGVRPPAALVETVHAVWAEVLEDDRIGLQDNFFDIGGDSLRAVSLAGLLRAEGFEVSAADVFAHQTVEELAAWCARGSGAAAAGSLDAAPVAPFQLLSPEDRAALPSGIVDAYPLATMQLGMLIELRNRPDVNTYQDSTSYRVRDGAALDPVLLTRAAQLVVDRHEVLRTSFDLNSYSVPLQLVHAAPRITVGTTHHGLLGPGGWRPELERYAAAERRTPFDLADPPLIRVHAHTADEAGEWWITITECHPILEGWSFHTMLMEILDNYRDLRAGRAPDLPPAAAFRYADYIAAEAAARESADDRAYWRGVVEGRTGLALPTAWQGDRALARERYQHMVDFRDLESDLRRLAAETRTSMKAVLLAAHMKVMSAVGASEDFHTGLVCDARPEVAGADRVLGMYLNTVPFALPTGPRTWGELVRAVYDSLTELWPHRVFPMQAIQQEFGPGGRLLEVFFNYLDFHQVDKDLIDEDSTYNDNDNEFALHVFTITGILKFNTTSHRLSRPAAERLSALYRTVLEQMALGPDGDARAAWLPAEEREILRKLDRAEDEPEPFGVLEEFARTVREHPDAVAVRCGTNELTYARLAELATTPNDAVPPGERTARTIAALLAALRAGTAAADEEAVSRAVARLHQELAARGAAPTPGSGWLCAHPLTTPAGLVDVLTPLTAGATLLLTQAALPEPEALPELQSLLADGAVTHLHTTPYVAELILPAKPTGVITLILNDEQGEQAGPWPAGTNVIEAVATDQIPGPIAADGIPLPGLTLHVLDSKLRPLPAGVVGDLHVGGLTDDEPAPHRTGLRARVGVDGRLRLTGSEGVQRTQELLAKHPAVAHCRVVERTGQRLAAYVSTAPGQEFDPDELRRSLAERRLPRHLIPDHVVHLDTWPLTPSGTVALHALPEPAAEPEPSSHKPRPWDERYEAILADLSSSAGAAGAAGAGAGAGADATSPDPDIPLADLGLSSVATVGLMLAIEQEYDIVFPDDFQVVDMFRTPRMLWERVSELRAEQA